jgi:hypothetical protein
MTEVLLVLIISVIMTMLLVYLLNISIVKEASGAHNIFQPAMRQLLTLLHEVSELQ